MQFRWFSYYHYHQNYYEKYTVIWTHVEVIIFMFFVPSKKYIHVHCSIRKIPEKKNQLRPTIFPWPIMPFFLVQCLTCKNQPFSYTFISFSFRYKIFSLFSFFKWHLIVLLTIQKMRPVSLLCFPFLSNSSSSSLRSSRRRWMRGIQRWQYRRATPPKPHYIYHILYTIYHIW